MCLDPITATMTAVSVAGAVTSGVSKYQTANVNAAALESSAAQRLEKAKYDVEQADRRYRRQAGSVEALIGTTGIGISSFLDVLSDDAAESALEKKAIKLGAQVEANNLRFQAEGQKRSASGAILEAGLGVAGAVVGGFGRSQQVSAINAKSIKFGGVTLDDSPFAQ
jgi:hypothetical protein